MNCVHFGTHCVWKVEASAAILPSGPSGEGGGEERVVLEEREPWRSMSGARRFSLEGWWVGRAAGG